MAVTGPFTFNNTDLGLCQRGQHCPATGDTFNGAKGRRGSGPKATELNYVPRFSTHPGWLCQRETGARSTRSAPDKLRSAVFQHICGRLETIGAAAPACPSDAR